VTHAASAPISQTGRLSPVALAFAILLHVLAVLGLLYLTPFRPFKLTDQAIEIVYDGDVPPTPEAIEPSPQPPSPQPPAPPQTLAMPKEPPGPPAEQVVPPPEPPPPPPTANDFPIPAPPPAPPAPPTPPRPQPPQQAQQPPPQQQPRPPADNRAAVPQPSPLRPPGDVILGPRNPASTDYFRALANQLARQRYYPQSARDRNQMGRVVMRVTIARDGQLIDARVDRSSGVPAIDAAELDTIRKAAPFPPLPFNIAGDTAVFLLPVTYELR
jgi:protein TonB